MESPSSSVSTIGDVSLSPGLSASSLFTTPKRKTQSSQRQLFKVPSAPKPLPKYTCAACNKKYVMFSYYDKHLKMHALKDAAARVPDVNLLLTKSRTIGRNALQSLMSIPAVGKYGGSYKKLLQDLLQSDDSCEWESFVTFVSQQFTAPLVGKSITLPSAMLANSLKDVEKITSDLSIRIQCIELLSAIPCCIACDSQVLCIFLCDFVFHFCDQFLILLAKTLRNADEAATPSLVHIEISDKDKQTIHYVAGASVRALVRFARKYPKNKYLSAVLECLKSKVIENPEICPANESDRAWTEMLNRGALTFVGKDALEFFYSVAKIILRTDFTKSNKGPPRDVILAGVCNGESKYIWDSVVGNTLKEDWSMNLMIGLTKSFTNTYGGGVALKYMNAASKNKPTCAVPLRQSLAPRGPLPAAAP